MFQHVKDLQFDVRVSKPDPRFANLLLQQFGGGNGELKAAMQYFVQAFGCRRAYPDKYDLLMDIAAEEFSHLEIVGATITLLLEHWSLRNSDWGSPVSVRTATPLWTMTAEALDTLLELAMVGDARVKSIGDVLKFVQSQPSLTGHCKALRRWLRCGDSPPLADDLSMRDYPGPALANRTYGGGGDPVCSPAPGEDLITGESHVVYARAIESCTRALLNGQTCEKRNHEEALNTGRFRDSDPHDDRGVPDR